MSRTKRLLASYGLAWLVTTSLFVTWQVCRDPSAASEYDLMVLTFVGTAILFVPAYFLIVVPYLVTVAPALGNSRSTTVLGALPVGAFAAAMTEMVLGLTIYDLGVSLVFGAIAGLVCGLAWTWRLPAKAGRHD